jgi:hypothetical protein
MPIRPGSDEQHTFRVIGRIGARPFETEINGTEADARAKASEFETPGDTDGIFSRGRSQIFKWTGTGFSQIDRYGR